MLIARPWFRRVGWLHLPVSWQGTVGTALPLMGAALAFVAVDRHSQSVSDTLWGIFPYWASFFLLWDWLARRKANADNNLKS